MSPTGEKQYYDFVKQMNEEAQKQADATVNAYKKRIDTTDDKSIDVYADETQEVAEETTETVEETVETEETAETETQE